MKRLIKSLICIDIFFIIVLSVLFIIIYSYDKATEDNYELTTTTKETTTTKYTSDLKLTNVVGVYHSSNYKGREETVRINDDHTCKYIDISYDCKWELSDNGINIFLYHYEYSDELGFRGIYNTYEQCNEKMKKITGASNQKCELITGKIELISVNNGILVQDHLFNKIK